MSKRKEKGVSHDLIGDRMKQKQMVYCTDPNNTLEPGQRDDDEVLPMGWFLQNCRKIICRNEVNIPVLSIWYLLVIAYNLITC